MVQAAKILYSAACTVSLNFSNDFSNCIFKPFQSKFNQQMANLSKLRSELVHGIENRLESQIRITKSLNADLDWMRMVLLTHEAPTLMRLCIFAIRENLKPPIEPKLDCFLSNRTPEEKRILKKLLLLEGIFGELPIDGLEQALQSLDELEKALTTKIRSLHEGSGGLRIYVSNLDVESYSDSSEEDWNPYFLKADSDSDSSFPFYSDSDDD